MKLLKLDARFEDARRVARCLVGSHCALFKSGALAFELAQQLQEGFIVCRVDQDRKWESILPVDFILLPTENLKFCPFVAMRENLWKGTMHCPDGFDASIIDGSPRLVEVIAKVERGELEGCEIVGIS